MELMLTVAQIRATARAARVRLFGTRLEAREPADDIADCIHVVTSPREKRVEPTPLHLRVELRQRLHLLARDAFDVRLLVHRFLVENRGDRLIADGPRDAATSQ